MIVVQVEDDRVERQPFVAANRASAAYVLQAVEQPIEPRADGMRFLRIARQRVRAFVRGAQGARAALGREVLAERLRRTSLGALGDGLGQLDLVRAGHLVHAVFARLWPRAPRCYRHFTLPPERAHLSGNERRTAGVGRAKDSCDPGAGWRPGGSVLTRMRLWALLFTATLVAAPAVGQQIRTSPAQDARAAAEGQPVAAQKPSGDASDDQQDLPVSLDKIKHALQQHPLLSLRTIDERPTFRVQIQERMKIEELLASMKFKPEPVPAGGVYMAEQQRVMFPSVDNPLVQPLAAFNQGELLTILVENLARKYLGDKAAGSISKAERARAEAAAREEVHTAVEEYCNAQANAGSGLAICSSLGR